MANRGRPKVIDDKVRDVLLGLVALGCSRKQAARHAGVGPRTLFRSLAADAEFAQRLRLAEMQQDVSPLKKILEQSQTSWRAGAWLLERQNPERYGRRAPMMVTRADCMAFVRSVVGFLLGNACLEDRQRATDHLERLDVMLAGRDATTPFGRRVVKELKAADALWQRANPPGQKGDVRDEAGGNGTRSVPATEANCGTPCGTAPEGAENARNPESSGKNAAFEQGGGI